MSWLSKTVRKVKHEYGDVFGRDVANVLIDPFGVFDKDEDKKTASPALGAGYEPGAAPTRVMPGRNVAMQDALARSRLGIGNSRGRSRHVNPVGSNPQGSNISRTSQGGTTPAVQTGRNPPAENIILASTTLPAGRYSYLDLVLQSDVPITPDNPFYNMFNSKFARRL